MSFEMVPEPTEIEDDIAYQKYLRQIDPTPERTLLWEADDED